MSRTLRLLATAAALLSAVALRAQQPFVGAGFTTLFDNREYAASAFPKASETIFAMRLTPYAGLRWAECNSLTAAVELTQDFGDESGFLTEVKPLVWYSYEAERVLASAGIFPREQLRGSYGDLFFDPAWRFRHSRIQGLMGQYRSRTGFVELAIDWEGMQSREVREKFRILTAGEWAGRYLYGGYALTLLHYAKTSDPAPDEGVVDHIVVNPYGGVRFRALFNFDIRLGYVQTLQRDRMAAAGWKTPKGGALDIRMDYKGLQLGNMLYAGENLAPFYGRYGTALYASSPFFGTRRHIYNRTDISYARRFFSETLGVRAGLFFHYDGTGLSTSQMVEVDVRLQKIFAKRRKAHENR